MPDHGVAVRRHANASSMLSGGRGAVVAEGLTESSSIQTRETNEETESVMRLVEISAGYWLPRVLHVVADLGVADALDEEPRSAG